MEFGILRNYINGQWVVSKATERREVRNPATGEVIALVPMTPAEEVDQAVRAAREAFRIWRETPPVVRARYLSRLKALMEQHAEELAQVIVKENGKTLAEARGELRRALENLDVAAGIPALMMGYNAEDIAQGIDEEAVLQPLGVFCCVTPFNFPLMVPFWFMPYAVACGNTYVIKPSDVCPVSQVKVMELIEEAGFPPGVINLVHGAKETVDALLNHPDVVGVSFVGSTPVARYIYSTAAANGKRVQCQGGAKNCLVVMPDAPLERTVDGIVGSAYGMAGQRCLAGSLVLPVGEVHDPVREMIVEQASKLRLGYGLDEGVNLGPVVTRRAMDRILGYIDKGLQEGAQLVLDGRGVKVEGYPNGYFIAPTLFDRVDPNMVIAREEIFGPVLGIIPVADLNEALEVIDNIPYGNAASIFTSSGKWAREFKYRVRCGNIGVNIGVAAPVATFPFSGMKNSFFGDLHGQGRDAINFFTERKVVITRWF